MVSSGLRVAGGGKGSAFALNDYGVTGAGYETGERRFETGKRPSFEPAITRMKKDGGKRSSR